MPTYVEKNPPAGERPPYPGPAPERLILDNGVPFPNPAFTVWAKTAQAYNTWVQLNRRHIMAKALDELLAAPKLTAAEIVTKVLAIEYFEDHDNLALSMMKQLG